MYVPTVLSEGKMLYRDIWFPYGPVAPYLNSLLFRLFGVHLNVLYLAGSLSALGCAAFLFLTGMRLGSWVIGWAAGAVVLVQSFASWLFCFTLPYSYCAVYGCLTACAFVWFVVRACSSTRQVWVFASGITAAVAFLLKPEYGTASYITLILLIGARGFQRRSWRSILRDLLTILPGVLLCAAVIGWMVSIGGVYFIIQENLAGWPTAYFMQTYGKAWLEFTGFIMTPTAFGQALVRTAVLAAVGVGVLRYSTPRAWQSDASVFLAAEVCIIMLAFLMPHLPWPAEAVFRWLFFPQDMRTLRFVGGCFCMVVFLQVP